MEQVGTLENRVAGISHHVRDGILVVEMYGRAGPQVLLDHVMANLDDWIRCDKLLYDFSHWDVGSLTAESFLGLGDESSPVHARRRPARAALLITPHLQELAGILIAIYETRGLPLTMRFFFDWQEAEAWLREDRPVEQAARKDTG